MLLERGFRSEPSFRQRLLAKDAEPTFDLVEPGRAGWSEMKLHTRVRAQPRLDLGRAVSRGVVDDHVQLLLRVRASDLLHERQEVGSGMCLRNLVSDATGRYFERCEQVHDAMTLVVVRVPCSKPLTGDLDARERVPRQS